MSEDSGKKKTVISIDVKKTDSEGNVESEGHAEAPIETEEATKEDLQQQLAEIARLDFEKSKTDVSMRLRKVNMDELAEMAMLVDTPEQLNHLESVASEREQRMKMPSGRATMLGSSSEQEPFKWKNQTFSSAKEMIDTLYNRLENKDILKQERDEIDKTLSELFRKYKGNAEYKQGET